MPLAYLWRRFREVLCGVASNGMAPTQIAWTDLAAWRDVTGARLAPWEARTIVRLSVARANILVEAEELKRASPNKNSAH